MTRLPLAVTFTLALIVALAQTAQAAEFAVEKSDEGVTVKPGTKVKA